MFIAKNFVFLELHKTGCTQIRNILKDYVTGELVGMHNQAQPGLFTSNRSFLGSVRNPWEWYLSLWAYGCAGKGAVFQNTRNCRRSRVWADTYRDVNDAAAFRAWVHMMNDTRYASDIRERRVDSPFHEVAGLLTHRYLRLFCTKSDDQAILNELATYREIRNFESQNCFIDHFIRNETLETDLFHGLQTIGVKLSAEARTDILSRPRMNSTHRRAGPDFYYDIPSRNLVMEKERLIVDRFGYTSPFL